MTNSSDSSVAAIIFLIFVIMRMLCVGSVAEWSKALVLGTSLFGGVGANPTAAIFGCMVLLSFSLLNIRNQDISIR